MSSITFLCLLAIARLSDTSVNNDRYKDNYFWSKIKVIPLINDTSSGVPSSTRHHSHSLIQQVAMHTTSATTMLDTRQQNDFSARWRTKPEVLEPEVVEPEVPGRLDSNHPEVMVINDELTPEMDDILVLMHAVAEQLAGLKSVVHHLKIQNQMLYKQLKRTQSKCSIDMSSDDPNRPNAYPNSAIAGSYFKSNIPKSSVKCPDEFEYSKETKKCYQIAITRVTWRVARERCQINDAELVSIETAKEQRYIMERARKDHDTAHCDFWIGLTKKTPDERSGWYWVEHGGAISYSNWNYAEPNNGNGYEHCTQMLWIFKWKWNDASCNHGNACYICQLRKHND